MKLLQLPYPGNKGGLGNQLFTIASTLGIALKHGYKPVIPHDWKYRHCFNIPDEFYGEMIPTNNFIKESKFEYCDLIPTGGIYNVVNSYLQSPKYWDGYGFQIREWLRPKDCNPASIDKTAIHYRRGDYLNNPNYVNLPMGYYLGAYQGGEICAFSDDPAFIQLHHGQKSSDEITDLCNMIACKRHIISNSSFAWWGAYLSGGNDVTFPADWFAGKLSERASTKDLFPANWVEGSYWGKFNAMDVTFIIPFSYDHPDRLKNLTLIWAFLTSNFDTNIIIGEINTSEITVIIDIEQIPNLYMHFDFSGKMHRTKALNEMTKAATTPYVINWDTDVLCSPWQIVEMINRLRAGADMVYPYSGPMTMVPKDYREKLRNDLTLSPLAGKKFPTAGAVTRNDASFGGAVGFNKAAYMAIGGENENFVSYGSEDQERWHRANLLGLRVERVPGQLFHIDHHRGINSTFGHADGKHNQAVWEAEKKLSKDELINYIKTWEWFKS